MSFRSGQKVSILIPVYNRERYIQEALRSALSQTYENTEIVLVDNASTDGTWDVACQIAALDARIKVFRNAENIGPVRNWLKCVEYATGDYIKILWSDDLLHPEFLEKTLPCLQDDGVGFVYSAACAFSSDQPDNGPVYYSTIATGRHPTTAFVEGALLGGDYPVSPGCALFRAGDVRSSLLEQIPNRVGSDFTLHAIGNDLLLFLLVASRYPFFHVIAEPLSFFRVHDGSITVSSAKGRIPLHYDIAKAYFIDSSSVDAALQAKFNALLRIHLLKYRAEIYGISRVSDFYITESRRDIDYAYLVCRFAKAALRALVARLKRWHHATGKVTMSCLWIF